MIRIGLAGWGDHPTLYKEPGAKKNKLAAYSRWFNSVEVDSTFYAVQSPELMKRGADDTPPEFRFVVKAYQGMTGYSRGGGSSYKPFASEEAMYAAFHESLAPLREAGKLAAVLFQYPPWFDCSRPYVDQIRKAKRLMGDVPVALEFRHQSWFEPDMRERTLDFTRREGWMHTVCDEPQAGEGSVPIVEAATDEKVTIVRLHGRNKEGWVSTGQPNWREIRYLYRYNKDELEEWVERLRRLDELSQTVYILFNNNSGGDAADNALQLMQMLDQLPVRGAFEQVKPVEEAEQLELFD
ncbi:DUF72 domain-containing protein [Paenibacillus baekrokdamisoli]|nr:DUF72 domain-containing protein [Paenibacillus baekrokdamisoli]